MNMTSSGLQCEVAYWPAMTLGGAAQVAAAHCPNERTLDPAVCSYNQPTHLKSEDKYSGLAQKENKVRKWNRRDKEKKGETGEEWTFRL